METVRLGELWSNDFCRPLCPSQPACLVIARKRRTWRRKSLSKRGVRRNHGSLERQPFRRGCIALHIMPVSTGCGDAPFLCPKNYDAPDEREGVAEGLERRQKEQAVRAVVSALPERQRAAHGFYLTIRGFRTVRPPPFSTYRSRR